MSIGSIRLKQWLGVLATIMAAWPALAAECRPWPAWDAFRDRYVEEGGRVVDRSSERQHSTSEGQSYALFFALVANDRPAFDRVLRWTEENLAEGDLTGRLPAWQWGKRDDGTWGVIDSIAASDSDLWIAYALTEAGRLWKAERYAALGELLAERILREETEDLPGLGQTLLPGPKGFKPEKSVWRLNPSYVPLQLVQRMATLFPKSPWRRLVPSSVDLIVRSAPRGFAPEWVLYKGDDGFAPDPASSGEGSFNAIRVYLWAGMLATDEPARAVLVKRFSPMVQHVLANGTPPLKVDTREGSGEGVAPAGFSAALLPLLDAANQQDALSQQRLRVIAKGTLARDDNYYDQVLSLYGLGWHAGQFKFARNGALIPRWTCTASSSSP